MCVSIHIISKPPVAKILIYKVCVWVGSIHTIFSKSSPEVEDALKSYVSRDQHTCMCVCVCMYACTLVLLSSNYLQKIKPWAPKDSQRMGVPACQTRRDSLRGIWPGLSTAHVDWSVDVPVYTFGKCTDSRDLKSQPLTYWRPLSHPGRKK